MKPALLTDAGFFLIKFKVLFEENYLMNVMDKLNRLLSALLFPSWISVSV